MLVSAFVEVISLGAVLPFLGILMVPEKVFNHPIVQNAAPSFGITSADQLVLPLTVVFAVGALLAGVFRTLSGTGTEPVTTPTSEDTAATKPSASSPDGKKNGFVAATLDELKLVVWPTRQQLFSESIAVILMVSLSAAAIASVSRLFSWSATQVFR